MASTELPTSEDNVLTLQKVFDPKSFPAQIESVANVLGMIGDRLENGDHTRLSSVVTAASSHLTSIADYSRNVKLKNLPSDVASAAKTNPLAFAVGAFATGLLLARIVKTTGTRY